MYGRNNIFSSNTNYGSNYGSNSTSNYSNSYRNNNQKLLGSYRLDYKYEEPPQYLVNSITQWKENFPSSIVAREETIHFTTTQLRIEDYYLIRKKDLKSIHENRLRDAIRNECFNEEITKIQFPKLPPISEERPLDIDAIKSARSNTNNNSSGSYTRDNETRGNIFTNNSSNNVSTNIFSQNSNNRSGSYGYSSGYGSNNSYGNNNNNSYGNSNSSNYGNNNNNSGNIFTSNRQGSSNMFNNNNSGGSGGNNIFSSNQGSSGNTFTNNNNNSNSNNIFGNRSGGNNIFSNSSNNSSNNTGNNIFGNRSGGNNLFNNSNNNSNMGIPPEFLLNFQYVLQQANKIMKAAQQNNNFKQQDQEEQNTRNYLTPLEELAKRDQPLDINYFLQDSRKRPQIQSQTIKLVKPEWFEEYQQLKMSQIHTNQSKVINNSRMPSNRSELLSNNASKLFNNYDKIKNQELKKTDSRYIVNRQQEAPSVRKSTIRMQNIIEEWLGPCICDFQLQIEWEDDDRHQMKIERIRGKVQMQQMRHKDPEWQKSSVLKLKQKNTVVRCDAQILVNSCSQKQGIAGAQFVIKGRLRQKIMNLPVTYKSSFSQIKEGMLYNLVISNQYGSICWDKPINAYDLDFAVESQIAPLSIGQNEVICQLDALNTSCRVSFVGLPSYLEQAYFVNEAQFQKQVADFKKFVKQRTNGAFEVIDLWKNQKGSGYISGWTLLATQFPRIEQQVQIS